MQRCFRVFVFTIFTLIGSGLVRAQCTTSDPGWEWWGDTQFGLNPVRISVYRVAGPGTAGEFDGSGFLQNWSTYVANDVLSSVAWMELSVSTVGNRSGTLQVYVNGRPQTPVDVTASQTDTYTTVCLPISTQDLKFPLRGTNGAFPTGAITEFTITYPDEKHPDGDPQALGYMRSLNFRVMYPVMLIHGWNAGPWVWGPKPAVSSICTPNRDDSSDGGQNFVGLLMNMKIPFDCQTRIDPQVSIEKGSAVLSDNIYRVGGEFGSPYAHVHLVAHSKGGLFVRRFLQMNRDQPKGNQTPVVLSLTTLDTPHHGSSLADSVYAWNTTRTGLNFPSCVAFYLGRLNPWTRRKILQAFGPGANDLTVDAVAKVQCDVSSAAERSLPPVLPRTHHSRNRSLITTHRPTRIGIATGGSVESRPLPITSLSRTPNIDCSGGFKPFILCNNRMAVS
ncbi:MAG: esterase/lipase family protein [Bryobacteraceae bacterium]